MSASGASSSSPAWRHFFCSTFVAGAYQTMGLIPATADSSFAFTPDFSSTGSRSRFCTCCAWCCACATASDVLDTHGQALFHDEVLVEWPAWGKAWESSHPGQSVDPDLGKRLYSEAEKDPSSSSNANSSRRNSKLRRADSVTFGLATPAGIQSHLI